MFKWPSGVPSSRPSRHELADFIELMAWQRGSISATAIARLLGRLDDNDYSNGVPEDDELDGVVEGAYSEIEWRAEVCQEGYPFAISALGQTLHSAPNYANGKHLIYKYLLLATRLNMGVNRSHANIDGTLLFEELASEVARNYLGLRAESLVFGTAVGQVGFREKVEELCRRLNEGDGFMNRDEVDTKARDGKLDVVTWKPFADRRHGKLIAFGQCKTGTEYRDTLAQLRPDSFCSKWLQSSPAVTPVRMFFISDSPGRGSWYSMTSDSGILFDRCRIIDFSEVIDGNVLAKIASWTTSAASQTALPDPNIRQRELVVTSPLELP